MANRSGQYSPVHVPPTKDQLKSALDNLEKEDAIYVHRAIKDVNGIATNFGKVSATELIAKLGILIAAREEFGPDVSLTNRKVMKQLIDEA